MSYLHPQAAFTCKHCGQEFLNRRSRKATYCSRRCSGLAQTPHSPPSRGAHLNPDYFWSFVQKSGGCWMWTGHRNAQGYGHIHILGKMKLAHRHAWEFANGMAVPAGLLVLHSCDTPACVNPSHLRAGTSKDNAADKLSRSRHVAPRGERSGNAKRTETEIREIRRLREAGNTYLSIARLYQTTPESIFSIVSRKTWRHVQ